MHPVRLIDKKFLRPTKLFFKLKLRALHTSKQKLQQRTSGLKSAFHVQQQPISFSNFIFLISNVFIHTLTYKYWTIFVNKFGYLYNLPLNLNTQYFSYFFYNLHGSLRLYWFVTNPYFLFFCKTQERVSFLASLPFYKYFIAASYGSFVLILWINFKTFKATILLPSKSTLLISLLTFTFKAPNANNAKKKIFSNKAGFYKQRRYAPKVRGVAQNAVDHPHGGRTKSIKYPRTPWGFTAKFK